MDKVDFTKDADFTATELLVETAIVNALTDISS
jgi:hypothetical protein